MESGGVQRIWAQYLHPITGNVQFQQLAVIDSLEWVPRTLDSTVEPVAYIPFPFLVAQLRQMFLNKTYSKELQQELRGKYQALVEMNTYHRDLIALVRRDGSMVVFGLEV